MASVFLLRGVLLLALSLPSIFAQDSCPGAPTFSNIASNCNAFHTIVTGDTCYSIEQLYSITAAQFLEWNPSVSEDCLTNFWPDYAYCVGVGVSVCSTSSETVSSSSRTSSTSSTSTTSKITSSSTGTATNTSISASTITSAVNATYSTRFPITGYNLTTTTPEATFPPSRTQAGQPSYCLDWHLVNAGDTCQSIVNRYGTTLSIDELLEYNPTLGEDCSGLFVGWWVCISIQSQTSLTLQWSTSATNATIPEATVYTPTTPPSVDFSFTATPTQTGIPSDCQAFYQAGDGDTCNTILAKYNYITEQQFMTWNPALDGNCNGLWSGYWYCVANFASGDLPIPATVTTIPSPTATGSSSDCTAWYLSTPGDNCDTVVLQFGAFSLDEFISWNPNVWDDCTNFQENIYYCVAIPGTPTTRTTAISTTTNPTSTPTQSGMITNCTTLWFVGPDDTCKSIVTANDISFDDFITWNPALGTSSTNCTLVSDYYVCVGTSNSGSGATTTDTGSTATTTTTSSTVSRTSTASTTSSAGNAVSTPSPVQAGMVDGCVRFYYVQSGDGCWAIATAAGIDLATFYEWNPAVTDCSTLWPDYYVCIGIVGPATTITSGPAVPT